MAASLIIAISRTFAHGSSNFSALNLLPSPDIATVPSVGVLSYLCLWVYLEEKSSRGSLKTPVIYRGQMVCSQLLPHSLSTDLGRDAARFGSNYLSKFGWDASKGLGAEGEGRTSHIKVSHKLDMLGIGAGQQRDPNGIAWKQNKDFESLLRRLNETEAQDRAVKAGGDSDETNDDAEETTEVVEKKKRKHKHDGGERSEEQPPKKKKSKKDRRESDEVEQPAPAEDIQVVAETSVTVEVKKKPAALPRHRSCATP